MKRLIPFLVVLLGCLTLQAAPVSLEEARTLGQRFVQANFEPARQDGELALVYSKPSFYVFNVGEAGFVIISAYANYTPLLGYSQEGVFNPDDMAPALEDFLDRVDAYRTVRTQAPASLDVARDWESLRNNGTLVSRYGGREGTYLVQTKWNQNYPYNYCCTVDADGPGGHAYAGCVATAGAQVMKYWNHPLQGQGSHTYTPDDNPQYGAQTANFGATTYDWDHMPISINSNSPTVQIEAVATLIYHVGVSVDMNYRATGSGATTSHLMNTLPAYFSYTNHMEHIYRESCTRKQYCDILVSMIDMGWPMVHRGNGHAYVVDGYDDAGMFHINWGWSGSNDAFYDIDGHNYADGESVICNCVPAEVYNATPKAPTNLTVTPDANNGLSATLTWTNPSLTLVDNPLTAIDQIVVLRNNEVVYTEDNVAPGASMTITDTSIPLYTSYSYSVYAVTNGQRGKTVTVDGVNVGPACQWKFVLSSANMMGFRGSRIVVYDYANNEVGSTTITSSNPATTYLDVPIGQVKFFWELSDNVTSDFDISINIKDFDNHSVYTYSGNIRDLYEGLLYEGNNGCGLPFDCGVPSTLTASHDEDDPMVVVLQWEGVETPGYGYLVFRDDQAIAMTSETSYRDESATPGGHCYLVTTLCEAGMNGEFTNMVCEASGSYAPPRNLDIEILDNHKCQISWERPSPDNGLQGYYVYRRTEDGEYNRIKALGANKTSYKENQVLETETVYYYKVEACYPGATNASEYITSAPAAYVNNPYQYYVSFYYSVDAVNESDEKGANVYPNPTSGVLTIEAPNMQRVTVYNLMGQCLLQKEVDGDATSLDLEGLDSGMLLMEVQTSESIFIKKIIVE